MRVALELTGLELDKGGTARAARSLLVELRAETSIELLTTAHGGREPRTTSGRIVRGLKRELFYFPVQLPRWIARELPDLVHCLAPLAPRRSAVPVVISVYDVIPWDHPEWLTSRNVRHQRTLLPRMLERAAYVVTSSEYSRARMIELFALDPESITSVPLGVDERFSPGPVDESMLAESGVKQPFVLTVGTLQPRKNIDAVLQAFERVVAAGAPHHLVVAGARGWSDRDIVVRLAGSALADRVHLTGRVSDQQLVNLYRAADFFVFPSRYEGFGLPPLEAMACGTPVISSDRTSLPEVVGDAGLLVDPDDVDQIARAVEDLTASAKLREDLAARGLERAREFTWRRTAERTLDVYRRVVAG